jgi:hypothetical protein
VLSSLALYQHVVFFDSRKSVRLPTPSSFVDDLAFWLRASRHFPPQPSDSRWGIQFRGFTTVHFRYNLLICSPPLSELTGLPQPTEAFTSGLSTD